MFRLNVNFKFKNDFGLTYTVGRAIRSFKYFNVQTEILKDSLPKVKQLELPRPLDKPRISTEEEFT